MYIKYFTLQSKSGEKIDQQFPTFEGAYDAMCRIYLDELQGAVENPARIPKRYGIYQTTVSDCGGKINTMIQPVWS